MPSTAPLFVAIYENNEGIYSHWSLFIDGPTRSEKTILHITGYSTNFHFEMRNSNARDSKTLLELLYICDVPVSKISTIKDTAKNAPVHNQYPGYNCQDYVLELIGELEKLGIINGDDESYIQNKKNLLEKQEGLA